MKKRASTISLIGLIGGGWWIWIIIILLFLFFIFWWGVGILGGDNYYGPF